MTPIDALGIGAATGVVAYSIFIAFCRSRWTHIPCPEGWELGADDFSVTVVVVARNESKSILPLLRDLAAQEYPRELLEVVLVDDQSEDDTVYKAETFALQNHMKLQIIHLATKDCLWTSRKKQAIMQVASLADSDILMLTDADCRVSPQWVSSHIRYYKCFPDARLVFGAFCFKGEGLVSSLLNLEALSLTAVAAVSNWVQKPTMCSGANISYRRHLVHELQPFDGNQQLASGDDEFMLHAVHMAFPFSTYYNKDWQSLVFTSRPESIRAFYQQRRRWAGKWKAYRVPWPKLLAMFVTAGNLSFIALLFSISLSASQWWLLVILAKWVAEYALLTKLSHDFKCRGLEKYFVLMEIIYPFYAIFFGIASNFGKYHWKGRRYS